MNKFSKWTGLTHSILTKSHPKLKLSQARECLATWLGHRTYASLCVHDLDVLLGTARYAIVDAQAAIDRANRLGFPVTSEQWREVQMTLSPTGISSVSDGLSLTGIDSMSSAARNTFEGQSHPAIDSIWQQIGTPDGRWTTSIVCHTAESSHPDELRFTVHGQVQAYNEHDAIAVPVVAQVLFKRLGIQLYSPGDLISVMQNGQPHSYEPDVDSELDFEDCGIFSEN
jgi:hypothetical protein